MSWSEIKKAVNSNLDLPLDEKIEYIGGGIPRGRTQKTVPASINTTTSTTKTLLDIKGKGVLLSLSRIGESAKSTNLVAAIDGAREIKLNGVHSGSYILNTNLENMTSALQKDYTSYEMATKGTLTVNFPLVFEKSLKVVFSGAVYNENYPSSGSVSYILFD